MQFYKLAGVFVAVLLIGACSHIPQRSTGYVLPGTRTAVNDIYIKNGKPAVRYETIVLRTGQRVVFAGPDEFRIVFKEGSIFEESNNNDSGNYPSRDGIVILQVSDEKTARLKDGTVFKYSVYVNGTELDPLIRWKKDD